MASFNIIKPPSQKEQYNTGWAMPALDKSDEDIETTVQKDRANHQSYISLPQSYTGLRDTPSGVLTLELSLLQLSKGIHVEAASILYGENEFQYVLAITRRHPSMRASSSSQPPYYDFRDNLTVLSERYMRMIKRCTVEVRLPTFPWTRAKKMYLQYHARLEAFATCFGGDDHSLQEIAILFNRCFRKGYYFPLSCLRTSQNVLETLAAICGVGQSVTVGGVTPAFETKLSSAMMSKSIACTRKKENYGKRMVILKGKRRLQRYKLERYHDSKKCWNPIELGPYSRHSNKARLAYECCEVCDGKSPLTFPPMWRLP